MTRVRFALAVSIVANLFLLGALAGGAYLVRSRSPMIFAGSLRIAGAELPRGEQRAFRRAMREERRTHHAELNQARVARMEAATLLRAPNLDQDAVIAQLAKARDADGLVKGAVEERAVRFAATLSPADRTKLADAMEDRVKKGRP